MKIGILGAGFIGGVMARTIKSLADEDIECLAVGARDLERARIFAAQHGIERAYGSYAELATDRDVDLIYIATPHPQHYETAKLALENGKNVLCEKPFTVNGKQARELCALAKSRGLLITEAIWTRYMPSRQIISDIIASGVIGQAHSLQANLGYPLKDVERMKNPQLAGGALLDLGVYTLNFALMAFGNALDKVHTNAVLSPAGVDLLDSITLTWKDGKMASLHATMLTATDHRGTVFGEKGYLVVTDINNPKKVEVFDNEHRLLREYPLPKQLTGYEYEVLACRDALRAGSLECCAMPHSETFFVLDLMDKIRAEWGLRYPCE